MQRGGRAFAAALLLSATQAYGSVVLRASETAVPGDAINLIGAGFDSDSVPYVLDVDAPGKSYRLDVLSQTSNVIQARIPATVPGENWRVFVVDDGKSGSNSVWINAARIVRFDSESVSPGQTLRIFGRNFVLPTEPSVLPQIFFRNPNTGVETAVVPSAATPYCVTVKVPSNIQTNTYTIVRVRSGSSPNGYVATAPDKLPTQPTGANPQGIDVPWASSYVTNTTVNVKSDSRLYNHATGNGVANDSDALREAISVAYRAGGGVVYIPSGTYRVDDGKKTISIPTNVVIKGDGPGSTLLQYGYRFTPLVAPAPDYFFIRVEGNNSGLRDMSIQNLNSNPLPNESIRTRFANGPRLSRFFMKNVDLDLANGDAMFFPSHDRLLFEDNTISCTSLANGPMYITACSNLRIRNNTISYRVGRVQVQYCTDGIVEGNTFVRDTTFSVPGSFESGGIETTCAPRMLLLKNTFDNVGLPMTTVERDGEIVLTQDFLPEFHDMGFVTSATSTSITDASKAWSTTVPWSQQAIDKGGPGTNRQIVAIVSGTGMGQWRAVVDHTDTTVNVDRPWQIVPDSTSRYAITIWTCPQQMILGNQMNNSYTGISLYHGGWDTVIDSNVLTDAGYISVRGDDRLLPNSTLRQHDPLWDVRVSNNMVVNQSGLFPAQIATQSRFLNGAGYGNLVLGLEVRDNVVKVITPCQNILNYYCLGSTEGYWASLVIMWDGNTAYDYAMQGLLMVGNWAPGISNGFNFSRVNPYVSTKVQDAP